nr:MAG TPA: hypothetical protein [Caudoviricetes sp.]
MASEIGWLREVRVRQVRQDRLRRRWRYGGA